MKWDIWLLKNPITCGKTVKFSTSKVKHMPHLSFQLKAFLMLANVSISIFSLLDNCNFSISHILTCYDWSLCSNYLFSNKWNNIAASGNRDLSENNYVQSIYYISYLTHRKPVTLNILQAAQCSICHMINHLHITSIR